MKDPFQSDNKLPISRRGLLYGAAATCAAFAGANVLSKDKRPVKQEGEKKHKEPWKATGEKIKQSVCPWCFRPISLDKICMYAKEMGLAAVELVDPEDWPVLKKYGLISAMTNSHTYIRGLNDPHNYQECIPLLEKRIRQNGEIGFPNVITFSGLKQNGMAREEAIDNTVRGCKKVIGLAEKCKVNLCLEILNSRVAVEGIGVPGYECSTVEWAEEVCRRVGSPRMKILFDVFHVQIMQGDVITRLRKVKDHIGHVHIAGNPGRHAMDDYQEINARGIMYALNEIGYDGYVGQEFLPRATSERGKIATLRKMVRLCDIQAG